MKILLGMSGGVDSTYAALKLMREGHSVEGATLVMHEYTTVDEAREAAEALAIPFHVIDCKDAFKKVVESNFIDEYVNARTPNPCTICNSEVKFRYLLEYAESHGFDAIATGHYADVVKIADDAGERYAIRRGVDIKKDQSYMLWRLPQNILKKLLLPLSDMQKSEIREESANYGLLAAERKDSQEICFIPNGDYAHFIEERVGVSQAGNFVDADGNVLGTHRGIIHYTVGQRRGLGISASSRIFVTEIDPASNTVTLSENDPTSVEVEISDIVYSGIKEPRAGETLSLSVKLRYAAPPVSAKVTFYGSRAKIVLDAPVRAVTPGQSAVLYDGDMLVAGGIIDK